MSIRHLRGRAPLRATLPAVLLALPFLLAPRAPAAAQGPGGEDPRLDVPHRVVRVTETELPGPAEPSVALDPGDPERIIGAFLSRGIPGASRTENVTVLSEDGGRSWTRRFTPNPHRRVQGDDAVALSADGLAVHSYISFHGIREPRPFRAANGIWMETSRDRGRSWASPVPVIDHVNTVIPFEDKPWPAVDDVPGSPYRGNVYVAWTRFDVYGSESPADSSRIWFARSTDGGRSFLPAHPVSDGGGDARDGDGTVEGAVPSVGVRGEVYLVWAGPRGLEFDRSLDGGATFGADRTIAGTPGGWNIEADGFGRTNGMPVTGVDRSDGPRRGSLYVNWIDQRHGDPDVFVIASRDGGESWGEAVRVNGDPPGNGRDQLFTWMAVDPADGAVNVVFLDRRRDGRGVEVTLARSVDGGASVAEYRVDTPPFEASAGAFYGDYLAIDAHGGRVATLFPRFTGPDSLAVSSAVFDFRPGTLEVATGTERPR